MLTRRRITWQEISGALGDIGTFLPLTIALVNAVGLDLGTTLIWTGLYNIVLGTLFDVPLPVQPMKAICAIAIATPEAFGLPYVLAAGIVVGMGNWYSTWYCFNQSDNKTQHPYITRYALPHKQTHLFHLHLFPHQFHPNSSPSQVHASCCLEQPTSYPCSTTYHSQSLPACNSPWDWKSHARASSWYGEEEQRGPHPTWGPWMVP